MNSTAGLNALRAGKGKKSRQSSGRNEAEKSRREELRHNSMNTESEWSGQE